MKDKTLVLSIALNGYQWMYHRELKSHKEFANKHGYTHEAVTKPVVTALGVECCWLKLTLMRTALLSGYDTVLFIDADAMVKPNTPELAKIYQPGKFIYMAKGHSNRFNSGVFIARKNTKTIAWLTKVIDARFNEVKIENNVGWGENGHVIEFSKGVPFIAELEQKWNNTFDYQLNDYIRHSNCGPMRTHYFTNLFHKVIFYLSDKVIRIIKRRQTSINPRNVDNLLIVETNKIISRYSKLTLS